MPGPLSNDDFRAVRWVLYPDDFAGGPDEPDPLPSDLIDEKTWHGLTMLPSDVAIRSTNYKGTLLRGLHEQELSWSRAVGDNPDQRDMLFDPMLDASDEYGASLFLAMHGYYRQAIGCLRNAMELVAIGAYCQVRGARRAFEDWRAGSAEMALGAACDGLMKAPAALVLENHLKRTVKDNLFEQRRKSYEGGWARRLYADLSDFAHSRPRHTNFDLWNSNGPIYEHNSLVLFARLFVTAQALCYVLVKLGRPDFEMAADSPSVFDTLPVRELPVASEARRYLYRHTAIPPVKVAP